jgi:hypothetical protein
MSHQRGDVVIALFPHADGSPPKARPVLIVQAACFPAFTGLTTDIYPGYH